MFYKGNNVKRVRYIFWVGEMPLYVSRKRFIDLNVIFEINSVIKYWITAPIKLLVLKSN